MEDYKAMSTPMITNRRNIDASREKNVDPTLHRKLIDFVMYLVNTIPNISYAVNSLSEFMVELTIVHQTTTKHVSRYLRSTFKYGIRYARGDGVRLVGYIDAYWASIIVDQKSTSGCFFSMGLELFLGTTGSISLWHWVLQRQSTQQRAWLHARLYGFGSCQQPCLVIGLRRR